MEALRVNSDGAWEIDKNRSREILEENKRKASGNKFHISKIIMKCAVSCAACLGFAIIMATITNASAATTWDTIQDVLDGNSQTIEIVLLLTAITLLPTLLIMLTGFTRIIIVLSLLRNAIGLQNMPPNIVLIGLSLFVTYFIMSPVLSEINETAYQPYIDGDIKLEEFAENAAKPLRDYMLKQTYTSDLDFFGEKYGLDSVDDLDEVPTAVVIVSYMTSELKHAFAIGFFLFIPFIVIDMIVASTLMAMGMMMLPPAMISLPFKILLFVLVNGWQMTIGLLISSFST